MGGCPDDELQVETTVVSLKDTLTGLRMAIPARFCDVPGIIRCFDLDTFLSSVERTRKWQCPNRYVLVRVLEFLCASLSS